MREKPILFSGSMVRAILERRKTQTRRVVKPQPAHVWGYGVPNHDLDYFCAHVRYPGGHQPDPWVRCPYGAPPNRGNPGDRLWVRETWRDNWGAGVIYRADYGPDSYEGGAKGWRPSIYMPRWASRINLEITAVRVERVQDISEADAEAEGIECFDPENDASVCRIPGVTDWDYDNARQALAALWDNINAKRGYSWASNPWVWVIEFRMVQP